ncbi:MAG: GNAT family N-acetyltransferase [Ilumatobacteraceae bacterium]
MTTDPASTDAAITGPVPVDAAALRPLVREAVLARRPVDARERWSIDEFVRRFDPLGSPFDEHADKVHVTASAIVTSDDGRRVLLHRHKRLQMWLQPGGHIEAGETPWQGALREAAEETGLPVSLAGEQLLHVDVHPGPRGHTHLDLRYAVTSPHVPPAPPEGESADVEWFAWHRAVAMAEPGLEGVLRALQPGVPTVRVARHNDARDAAQVYVRSRQYALPEVPMVHDEREVRRWMSDDVVGRTDMWVAELDGTLVGLMVLGPGATGADGARSGWIEQLYLDPAWIGRGLGDRFVEVARSRYPGGLQLWTFVANERARRFYERHGFVVEETGDGRGNEERAPDHRMHWRP